MSLRGVPERDLELGVTRLRHQFITEELIYWGTEGVSVWVRYVDDPVRFKCPIDHVELAR